VAIADVLIPTLRARFADKGLVVGSPPDPIAAFPARCAEVGDLRIYDDGEEVTLSIDKVAHTHVNPYDEAKSMNEVAQWVTDYVVEFLGDLFADRVLLWAVDGGKRMGGWQMGFGGEIPRGLPKEANLYVWSRRLR
jgi:hypothetical protein